MRSQGSVLLPGWLVPCMMCVAGMRWRDISACAPPIVAAIEGSEMPFRFGADKAA